MTSLLIPKLIVNLREFVSSYWPNPGTEGVQVQSMYHRLSAIDTKQEAAIATTTKETKANGQTNGDVVKRE